jgi:hypothetical protein
VFDHHYVFPAEGGDLLEAQWQAACELGVRMHFSRGSMDRSKKDGGLPPDSVVQTVDEIMKDSVRLIEKYQDTSFGSMKRIALAPCSPFSVSEDLALAHDYLKGEVDRAYADAVNNGMGTLEIIMDKYEGLKIPNSSIVEREVYKIDESYIAKNDDGDYFVKTVETSEDGTQETVEKPITYYRHEDTTYYVKADCFNDTDMIMKATGEDSKAVLSLERDTLQGVYIANEGVADFTEIQVKKTQDEFSIVSDAGYLKEFDNIVLDITDIEENQTLY